jgi:hypothetical protein
MAPAAEYVTRTDAPYRAFQKACKNGVADTTKGLKLHEFVGALICCLGYTEAKLPRAWTTFANAHPDLANFLRVSCQGFAMPGGERFHPVTVQGYKKLKVLLHVPIQLTSIIIMLSHINFL